MASRMTATEKKINDYVRFLEKHGYIVTPPAEPVVIDTTELNRRKLESRKQAFIDQLREYQGRYSSDLLNAFYAYWTEPNKTFTKMRFELQKTWDLNLRLSNWYNRNKKHNHGHAATDTDRADKLSDILVG